MLAVQIIRIQVVVYTCSCLVTMILKQDQKSWLKIECATGHNARQCYKGLREACGEISLAYRTAAWWVKAFRDGRQNVTDMPRPGRPAVSEDV